jgi:hypothetical protein
MKGIFKWRKEVDNEIVVHANEVFPPGHFYSPVVNISEVKEYENQIWGTPNSKSLKGIELNIENQILLAGSFQDIYNEIPFTPNKIRSNRYYFENDFYSYTDGIFLYSMIRKIRPNNIIEIGSGFSSALMLDVNHQFFANNINLTFVEPFTDRLDSLLRKEDFNRTQIIAKPIQKIDFKIFKKLKDGDFLFIDSTHVLKTGSDLQFIFNEIIPNLNSGVYIHFHDIFFPFEYPKDWVFNGRSWNENYFLKAFLMYNNFFEIILFADFLHSQHGEIFKDMPNCYLNSGGNMWIRKIK